MRKTLLVALSGVGLLVCGSATPSLHIQSAITINNASVTATWHESYLLDGKRKVTFSFTTSAAANLEASLRRTTTGRLISVKRLSVRAGTSVQTIELSARPVPGMYRLRLKTMPVGPAADRNVTIQAPPEGVVDHAYTSRTENGAPTKVIHGGTNSIFAHFHFVARPQVSVVKFIWKKPGNPDVRYTRRETKPYKQNVSTYVCAKYVGHACGPGQLRKGKWYCILKAAGRITKRRVVVVA